MYPTTTPTIYRGMNMMRTLARLIHNLRGPWIAYDPSPEYSRLDRANGLRHLSREQVERLWVQVHEDQAA